MDSWKRWFESIADKQVDRGGLRGGIEFSHAGVKEIPFDQDSITGYTIIETENLQETQEIASLRNHIFNIRGVGGIRVNHLLQI